MIDIFPIIIIFLANFIADFPLQGEFLGKYKSKSLYLLFVHCFIYAGLVALVIDYFYGSFLIVFIGLLLSHFIVDKMKCVLLDLKENKSMKRQKVLLYFDQTIHILTLLVIVWTMM